MIRYPGAVACGFLVLGIMLGTVIHLPDFVAFCLAAILLVTGLFALQRRSGVWILTASACCLMLAGMFRYNLVSSNPPQNDISWFNDLPNQVTVLGRVVREPDLRPEKTLLTIKCDTLIVMGRAVPVSGLLLARIDRFDNRFNYASRVSVTGFIRAPVERRNFHGFDYRRYLSLRRINSCVTVHHRSGASVIDEGTGRSLVSDVIIPLRKYILALFEDHIYGSERHLVAGLLIGETRFIPRQIYERFKDTGTLHLLAVSGSNVALVIMTVMALFRIAGVGRRLVDVLSLPVIAVFCHLSFNQPSVVRASLMIGLVLVGRILYRRGSLLNIMAVAALLILLYDPLMLYDVGFQLSFAAAFGLLYFLRRLIPKQRRYPRWRRWIKDYGWMIVLSSVVAQLTVAPILAYYFGTIPLVTFISNLIVIPLCSAALIMSLLLILFAPVPFLSDLIAIATQFLLHLSIQAVDLFASMPFVKLTIARPGIVHIALYYLLLFALFSSLRNRRRLKYLVLVLLVWANVFAWEAVADGFRRSPEVTFFDLGQFAGMHVHVPPDFDMIMTNAVQGCGYDPVERVFKPYLEGEDIRSVDIWDSCAPLEEGGLDSISSAMGEPGFTLYGSGACVSDRRLPDEDCSLHFSKSESGIEILTLNWMGGQVAWLSRWDHLGSIASDTMGRIEVLALPYPVDQVLSHLGEIIRLRPAKVVIYNYLHSRDRSGLDLIARELESAGISTFDTHRNGAIRMRLGSAGTIVRLSAAGS